MRDYVKELIKVWNGHGDEAAHDFASTLLAEIEVEQHRLGNQAEVIKTLGSHLEGCKAMLSTLVTSAPKYLASCTAKVPILPPARLCTLIAA